MASLLLLVGLIAWGLFSAYVARRVSVRFKRVELSVAVGLAVFILIALLPFMDEIVGGLQFRSLCAENRMVFHSDEIGDGLLYGDASDSYRRKVSGTWTKVWRTPVVYRSMKTDRLVLEFDYLKSEGGIFLPGFDSGNDPLIFKGSCVPSELPDDFFSANGLTVVRRPPKTMGAKD